MDDRTKVFNCDCLPAMKETPDKFYNLAICDPPYGIGFDREDEGMSGGVRKDGTIRKDPTWNQRKAKKYKTNSWDEKPSSDYFNELQRISKYQIIWGGNYFTDMLPPSGGWVVWIKGVPDGMTLSQAELAWTNCLNSIKVVSVLWAGYKKDEPTDRIHPTQKPIRLYKWLLKNYAKEGDKILDSHVGSGSSRIAAFDGGFEYVGYELDADYFNAQEKRFNQHKQQLKINFV